MSGSLSEARRRELMIAATQADLRRLFSRGLSHALGSPMQSLALALPAGGAAGAVLPEDVRFLTDVAASSLNSLAQILDTSAKFSALSTPGEVEPVRIEDLLSDLHGFQRFFRPLSHASLLTESDPGISPVRVSLSALELALLAVALNAAEAGEGARHVHVGATADREGVRIAVEDDGPGIAPSDRMRVFDPFHSRKGGEHRGLGLTVARLLLADHGGTVTIEEPAGGEWRGGRVVLTVPVWG